MTTIPQCDLRNHNARILDRVERGESFTVTRNGVPVADVIPHAPAHKPPRFRPASEHNGPRPGSAEAIAWLTEIAALDDVGDCPDEM